MPPTPPDDALPAPLPAAPARPRPRWADHARSRLRPTKALVHDAVDAVTWLVAEGHDAVGDAVVGAAAVAPQLARPVAAVDQARRAITGGVLASVRGVNRAVQVASDAALDLAGPPVSPEVAVPLRSDHLISVDGALDQAVGVLNGAVGDHLARAGNGLDMGMRLRQGDRWLDPTRPAVSAPTPRLVVLVHGLSTTELSWCLDADRLLGRPDAHFGALLAQHHGCTPVFVRYNTGRTVAQSGAALAQALARLVDAWPGPLAEVSLVGHSMGGLVSRAATAARGADPWLPLLRRVVCLGSPHQGAPLARLGQVATDSLRAVPHPATRVIGRILSHRSAGIHDLRHRDLPATGRLVPGARYLFVAGSLGPGADDLVARTLGDMLVPVDSASGPDGDHVTVHHVGRAAHHQLQTHPEVWTALRGWWPAD